MRFRTLLTIASVSANLLWSASVGDPREVVRKCVELDQSNWLRMKDYTWVARETTRHFDASGKLGSVDGETWARIEAKTVDTISWGLCFSRLNPGASLVFEQTRVNGEIWLPKREMVSGTRKIVLLKKVIEEQETVWTDYRKFRVDSSIISTR